MILIKSFNYSELGFSYIEVLVASFILAISLPPALDALQSGIQGSGISKTTSIDVFHLNAKMEEVLSQPFEDLSAAATAAGNQTTASSYSDLMTTTDGRQLSRQVYLSRYDGDNADSDENGFTGSDDNLLWVKVELAGTPHIVESLTNNYD